MFSSTLSYLHLGKHIAKNHEGSPFKYQEGFPFHVQHVCATNMFMSTTFFTHTFDSQLNNSTNLAFNFLFLHLTAFSGVWHSNSLHLAAFKALTPLSTSDSSACKWSHGGWSKKKNNNNKQMCDERSLALLTSEDCSAGCDSRLTEKTINQEKILQSAAKHMTEAAHGRGSDGRKQRQDRRADDPSDTLTRMKGKSVTSLLQQEGGGLTSGGERVLDWAYWSSSARYNYYNSSVSGTGPTCTSMQCGGACLPAVGKLLITSANWGKTLLEICNL